MRYDFQCGKCSKKWELDIPMALRDSPCKGACPCGKYDGVVSRVVGGPSIVSGSSSVIKKAGSGWNDVLKKIKKGSGRSNTINTR